MSIKNIDIITAKIAESLGHRHEWDVRVFYSRLFISAVVYLNVSFQMQVIQEMYPSPTLTQVTDFVTSHFASGLFLTIGFVFLKYVLSNSKSLESMQKSISVSKIEKVYIVAFLISPFILDWIASLAIKAIG